MADIFIKIGDIEGESQDKKHTKEIEVMSWSWGVTQAANMSQGGGGGVGKASFSDLSFTHYFDKASPNLWNACVTGKHIPKVILTQRKAGETPQDYLVITMEHVLITNLSPGGSDGAGAPVENVSLAPAIVNVEYMAQKEDGSLDAGVTFNYNIKAATV